jgi:predicted amino acid dehydrogenase
LDTLPASNALIRTVYPNTLIFVRDANAQYPKTLTLLQEELGGRIVTSLPGETDLQGDVVIIVGRDVKR